MRRRTLGLTVLAAVLASSLLTWLANAVIQSPAEVAARTAPPEPSPILVPVEQRELATKVVSRGTGHYGSPRALRLTPSALKKGHRVVTYLPRVGSVIKETQVLLTISGRPTFLLDGAQPSYRDLGPGMSGQDVRQLERALRRAGLRPGRVDGRYDAATSAAVARLYRKRGFAPVLATDGQLARVRPLEANLIRGSRAQGGIQLPADEVAFLPATPVRVTKRAARVGSTAGGTLMTVTDSIVAIDGSVPTEEANLLKTGAQVRIDEPALGINARGTLQRVAERPGTDGADGFHVAFRVEVPQPPPALVGASVRLTIPITSTSTTQLTVPVSAVSLGPDGASRVQRAVGGRLEYVPIEPGLSADGYVAITSSATPLSAGDMVVVGEKQGANGG